MSSYDDFINFHKENPGFFRLFSRFSIEAADTGIENFSARTVFERAKWEMLITIHKGNPEPVIDRGLAPYYARLAMEVNPVLNGFYKLKKMTTGEK